MMQRLEWKLYFANIALSAALRSTCPKAQVGAVLTKDREIMSTGYNGAPRGMKHCDETGCINDSEGHCIRTLHAEINSIIKAMQSIKGAELFSTHLPCIECCKIIINVGIVRVYYIHDYVDSRSLLLGYHSQTEFLREGGVEVERIDIMDLSHKIRIEV